MEQQTRETIAMVEEIETEELNNDVSRMGTLTRYIKNKTDKQISDNAKHLLMDHLGQICTILVRRAEQKCEQDRRGKIKEDDFQYAFEELLQPHVFIDQITELLDKQVEELKEHASNNSLIRFLED